MPYRAYSFEATILPASSGPHPPASDRLKHAAAIAIRHFSTPLITLDDVIHVEDDREHGSVTVREALEWARSPGGRAALAGEAFGLREQLVEFAERMLEAAK